MPHKPPALALNCYILGNEPNRIFQVKIAPTEAVVNLKKSIKA
jgi:hypothetical protein